MTDAETILWSRIRRRSVTGMRFRRQYPIGPYIVDFACIPARLVVEVDGATHTSDETIEYDSNRGDFLKSCGWSVLRFTNTEIYKSPDVVLDGIYGRLAEVGKRGE